MHPYLRRDNNHTRLIGTGKPFLMLAGELHNSSLSSARYMADVWPAMKKQGINTLLGCVSWEQIEPFEGKFDFSELDKIILGAREHNMRLVLLWFSAYKNALSTCAPSWPGGGQKILNTITPLSTECAEADARAFGKLLQHLKDFDADHSTILMIQVENEPGILGDSRDRSFLAEAAFREPVPEPLLRHLADNPHLLFAKRFPNVFMAFYFARYIERVAAFGKKRYPIPHYANAWLNLDGLDALDAGLASSVYPSGGPCAHVLDIWRFAAPSLDFISPDLYLQDYEKVCNDFTDKGNPLFIPEQRRDEHGARRIWLAHGAYGALGVSPFGIDTGAEAVGREYKLLSQVKDLVVGSSLPWTKLFGEMQVTVERASVFGKPGPGAGIIIRLADQKFLLVGYGFQVSFKSVKKGVRFTGILKAKEMEVSEEGNLRPLRLLNGNETRGGSAMVLPNKEPSPGEFPITTCIPARTGIAEVDVYILNKTT
ncbi:glycoside hydrolase superfamily [Aspergillus pseudodeflectus]|uniref:Glycoside hydrolase superfamily n=1 Tax=Aspergillus pseudodeflectus TaxID=176178 RepID=A0ABR4L4C1_9EURO